MTARIVYRTRYGKKAGLTIRIEELMREIKEMRQARLTIVSVSFKD